MRKTSPPKSSARRSAEALLNQSKKREASVKWEQEREYEAMVAKTARLRELRLAKEAADEEAALTSVSRPTGTASNQKVDEYNVRTSPSGLGKARRG